MYRLIIENIPTDIYSDLEASAYKYHHSIEEEAILRLKLGRRPNRTDCKAFLDRLEKLQTQLNIPPLTDEILDKAKREGRL